MVELGQTLLNDGTNNRRVVEEEVWAQEDLSTGDSEYLNELSENDIVESGASEGRYQADDCEHDYDYAIEVEGCSALYYTEKLVTWRVYNESGLHTY